MRNLLFVAVITLLLIGCGSAANEKKEQTKKHEVKVVIEEENGQKRERLVFPSGNKFEMLYFGQFLGDYKVVATNQDASSVVVSFHHASKPNGDGTGLCGAGEEIGFMVIAFENEKFVSQNYYYTESCFNSIGLVSEKKLDETKTEYVTENFNESKQLTFVIHKTKGTIEETGISDI